MFARKCSQVNSIWWNIMQLLSMVREARLSTEENAKDEKSSGNAQQQWLYNSVTTHNAPELYI